MDRLIDLVNTVHVTSACIGLAALCSPVVFRKGGPRHWRFGDVRA